MGDRSGIEWTDATWNPTVGCSRTSPGCDHCYAERLAVRLQGSHVDGYEQVVTIGKGPRWTGRVNVAESRLDQPLRWKRPRRVFVNSMSDLFHPEIDAHEIARIFAVMARAPQHQFQVLTKRSKRMRDLLNELSFLADVDRERFQVPNQSPLPRFEWPLPNVWLGVSIESDAYLFRARDLLDTPAAVRWISAEPLLGPLDKLDLTGIDWVVAGGESGPGARPMHPRWVRDLRDRCDERRAPCEIPDVPLPHSVSVPGGGRACACEYRDPVPFLFKQWGEWVPPGVARMTGDGTVGFPEATHHLLDDGTLLPREERLGMRHMQQPVFVVRAGKRAAGRYFEGRTWDEYPA